MLKSLACLTILAAAVASAMPTTATKGGRRWLDENNNNNNQYAFLGDYTLQYRGCANEQQWVDGAIVTNPLVHYSLCKGGCSRCNSGGYSCDSTDSGDFVVSLQTFAQATLENMCNNYGGDDDFLTAYCQVNYQDYMGCQQIDNNNGRRSLEEQQQQNSFSSVYCNVETSTVQLGVFSDNACTTLIEDATDELAFAFELPDFGSQCLMCDNADNDDNNNGGGDSTLCETVYPASGKCETNMDIDNPSDDSCHYIEGLFQAGSSSSGRKKTALLVTFGVLTALGVAAYAFYLRRRSIQLESATDALAKKETP